MCSAVNKLGRAFPFLWLSIKCVPVKVQVCVLLPSGSLEWGTGRDSMRFGRVLLKVVLRSVNRVFNF